MTIGDGFYFFADDKPKLIKLLGDLYKRTESAVIVSHHNTKWFKQTVGCIMSPDLFNLYLEHIMRVALDGLDDIGAKIAGQRLNNLRFADDIGLSSKTLVQAKALLDRVDKESGRFGQEISAIKTKYFFI